MESKGTSQISIDMKNSDQLLDEISNQLNDQSSPEKICSPLPREHRRQSKPSLSSKELKFDIHVADQDDVKHPTTMKSSTCIVEHYTGIDTPKRVNEKLNEYSFKLVDTAVPLDELDDMDGANRIMK